MRIVFGRGNKREVISFPTGRKVDVTPEHIEQMCQLLRVR